MSPFDWRSVVLAKHAQHVVLIHFPIALYLAGVGFDVAGRWLKRRVLADTAYLNFLIAAVFTVPAIASGLIAWQWALEGHKLKGILLWHLLAALVSTALIWLTWVAHFWVRRNGESSGPRAWIVAIEIAGVMALTITGHLGGFLSGVNAG